MTRVTNFQRAHWAAVAIEAFRDQVGTDDDLSSIHDLIADLGHYCALNDLDFIGVIAQAISCWAAERADPTGTSIEAGPNVSIVFPGCTRSMRACRQTTTTGKRAPRKGRGAAS